MRCKTHDLACAPDGRCIVCRREGVKATPSKRAPKPAEPVVTTARVWAALGVAFAVMGAGVAYRTLGASGTSAAPISIGPDVPRDISGVAPVAAQASQAPIRSVDIRHTPEALPPADAPNPAQPSAPVVAASATSAAAVATAAPAATGEAKPDPTPRAEVSIADVSVVVYTTTWCSVCKRAKAWMNAQGIPYDERDIEASSEDARAMHELNPRGGIPTFDIEGDVLVGFSEDSLLAKMKHAAQRDADRRHL